MKNLIALIVVIVFAIMAYSFNFPEDPKKVPEKYDKLINPFKADAASLKSGKETYSMLCRSCHGAGGKGDGNKAAYLETPPADFTSLAFQSQSDGAIFYRVFYVHKDMSSLKRRMIDNESDIDGSFGTSSGPGDLVNYLRTFSK